MRGPLATVACCLWVVVAEADAGLILDFREGQAGNVASHFDEDAAGDTAGPFTDPATGVTATLTTRDVLPHVSGYDTVLNTTAAGLGVNVVGWGGEESGAFDVGESWTFHWDMPVYFDAINFSGLASGEYFELRSDAWIGLAGVTPASGAVTYTAATGTFKLTEGEPSDEFALNDLTGGTLLPVSAGTDVVLQFGGSGYAVIEGMQWTAVPEPSAAALTLLALAIGSACTIGRWRSGVGGPGGCPGR